MKQTELLQKVRAMLGVSYKFAQANLDNGTVVEAEAFEAGNEIFIVTDDQKVPLPVGDYNMEDGKKLVVSQEGIIGEIVSVEAEDDKEEEMQYKDKEEMQEEEVVVEAPEEVVKEVEQIVEAVVEAVAPVIEEVKEEVQELKRKFEEQEEKKMEKEDEDKKEKMSRAARKPIKHNPEKKAQPEGFRFAQNKQMNTRDRVLQKIANFN